jgi:hypothetical protein
MRNVMFALTIMAMATTTASAQSSGPANAFFGGLGAYPMGGNYQQPLPPQTAREKSAFRRGQRLGEAYQRGQLAKPRYGSSGYIGK